MNRNYERFVIKVLPACFDYFMTIGSKYHQLISPNLVTYYLRKYCMGIIKIAKPFIERDKFDILTTILQVKSIC